MLQFPYRGCTTHVVRDHMQIYRGCATVRTAVFLIVSFDIDPWRQPLTTDRSLMIPMTAGPLIQMNPLAFSLIRTYFPLLS